MTKLEAARIIIEQFAERKSITIAEAKSILQEQYDSMPLVYKNIGKSSFACESCDRYGFLVREYLEEQKVKSLNLCREFSSDGMSLPQVN